jgi:pyruvate dehydrogenase E2 component (dihydrolipoamide acetyltransferase)
MVPVGGVLAYLVQPGEKPPFENALTPSPSPSGRGEQAIPVAEEGIAPSELSDDTVTPIAAVNGQQAAPAATNGNGNGHSGSFPTISPRARRIAGELGVDWAALKGSGSTGRIIERDVRAAAEQQKAAAAKVTPVARRVAEDLNVNLDQLAASMPGQRIEKAHVEAAAAPAPAASAPQPARTEIALPTAPARPGDTRAPLTSVRKTIAARMSASAHTAAPVTLTTEVDATELVAVRKRLKQESAAAGQPTPSYNDILAKLVAETLATYPALNARIEGDEVVQSAAVDIGIAVDTDRGLLVPVIRDVQIKSLRAIARDSAAAIERTRSGSLSGDDMAGGTFTITNLGMFDIDAFTPIINLPQCAILGVGRIVAKQVVIDADAEQLAIRHMMFLSLTFDHRLVDGAPAARFLQAVKQAIENPYLWLL